jgi:hypothetical protein
MSHQVPLPEKSLSGHPCDCENTSLAGIIAHEPTSSLTNDVSSDSYFYEIKHVSDVQQDIFSY